MNIANGSCNCKKQVNKSLVLLHPQDDHNKYLIGPIPALHSSITTQEAAATPPSVTPGGGVLFIGLNQRGSALCLRSLSPYRNCVRSCARTTRPHWSLNGNGGEDLHVFTAQTSEVVGNIAAGKLAATCATSGGRQELEAGAVWSHSRSKSTAKFTALRWVEHVSRKTPQNSGCVHKLRRFLRGFVFLLYPWKLTHSRFIPWASQPKLTRCLSQIVLDKQI